MKSHKKPLRICHIVWTLQNGGIENMVVDIINEQVKTSYVTLIIVNKLIESSIIDRLDTRCHRCFANRKIGSRNPYYILKINYFVVKGKFDIIHFHDDGLIPLLLVHSRHRVLTIHSMEHTVLKSRQFDSLVCISKTVEEIMRTAGYEKTICIENGINLSNIKMTNNNSARNGSFHIIQVGRLFIRQKGQDLLLNAVRLLVEKGYSDLIVDFIGEGESFEFLRSLAKRNNINNMIHFLGNCSREYIYNHLCEYDLLVQPSRKEGFGLTVAEAMAAKIPVLVSDNTGAADIINYGECGYSFQNGSAIDLADKLEMFILHENNTNMIEIGYTRILSYYSIAQTVKKYNNLYLQIVDNHK